MTVIKGRESRLDPWGTPCFTMKLKTTTDCHFLESKRIGFDFVSNFGTNPEEYPTENRFHAALGGECLVQLHQMPCFLWL